MNIALCQVGRLRGSTVRAELKPACPIGRHRMFIRSIGGSLRSGSQSTGLQSPLEETTVTGSALTKADVDKDIECRRVSPNVARRLTGTGSASIGHF